ncbi:MAG: fused MFS/spermidine synthase [Methylococcaceae bacterium]|nr:fused MFS/spermidine synthase [Methylococcaceae bacterium]
MTQIYSYENIRSARTGSKTKLQRYGGELIHSSRDEDGILEVVDVHGVRALHFGTTPRQSAMSLVDPQRLELAYIRAMLSGLLFVPEPERVLLVGLGGGTLAKFLLANYPLCQVDAVERRPAVKEIAHTYFALPRDERLRVQIADACRYLQELTRETQGEYDLILADVYDHIGMDPSVNAEDFFYACSQLIRPQGVFSMNLWGTHHASLKCSIGLLKICFPGSKFSLAVPNRGNIIGLGLGAQAGGDLKKLDLNARQLEVRLGLEMPYFLRNLRPL